MGRFIKISHDTCINSDEVVCITEILGAGGTYIRMKDGATYALSTNFEYFMSTVSYADAVPPYVRDTITMESNLL